MKTNEGQANENKKAAEKKSTLTGVVCTPAGNSIAPVYKRVFDDKLNRNVVKKVDTTNITWQNSLVNTELRIRINIRYFTKSDETFL